MVLTQTKKKLVLLMASALLCVNSIDLNQVTLSGAVDKATVYGVQEVAVSYKLVNPALTIEFSQNQITAISNMMSHTADFAIVLNGATAAQGVANPSLYMMPLLLTGFVPSYHINALGATSPPLVFPRQVITRIMTGEITRWNDPQIVSVNPLVVLPALNITVVFDTGGAYKNMLLKNALNRFDPAAFNRSGMDLTINMDFPTGKYSSFLSVAPTATSICTTILAVDGAFGVPFHSVAMRLGVPIGQMINYAGNAVTITEDSLTMAATQLGVVPTASRLTAALISDATGASAWPMAFFTYLMVDLTYSRSSCKSREYLVEFFLYLYQSPIAASILRHNGLVAVPSVVANLYNAVDVLSTSVRCGGMSALPPVVTSSRMVGSTSTFGLISSLLTSVYNDDNSGVSVVWKPAVASSSVLLAQLFNSELDMIFVDPNDLDPARWKAFTNSDDFLVVPIIASAVSWFAGATLTSTLSIPATARFVLDIPTMIRLWSRCISDWNSTALLELNPWLASTLKSQSAPIQVVMGCSASLDSAPIANWWLKQVAMLTATDTGGNQTLASQCAQSVLSSTQQMTNFNGCSANSGFKYVTNEDTVGPIAQGTFGGVGLVSVDTDPTKIYPSLLVTQDGASTYLNPNVDGIMACAFDTFSASSLSFQLSDSQNTSCWPFTRQVLAVVRKRYYSASTTNTSSCIRGLDTLKFLRYLTLTTNLDPVFSSMSLGRLPAVPVAMAAIEKALNTVLCDDSTLLIRLPVTWSLSLGLYGFGLAASSIGILFTCFLTAFIILNHRSPSMRASSPPFMLLSMLGVVLLFGGVIALVLPVSAASCNALSWLLNLGVLVTFAPVFAKTYRIYRIFGRRKLSVIKISNRKLLGLVAILLVFELILLTVWQIISPLQPVLTSQVQGSDGTVYEYTQCSTTGAGSTMFALVAVEKSALLLFGALMAFSSRKVSSQFNESSQTALAIYNILFSVGVIIPILFVISAQGDVLIALLLFLALWISFFTGSILVIPQVLHVVTGASDTAKSTMSGASNNSSSGFSFLSVAVLDTLPAINRYLAALQRHVEAVQIKQAAMKRSDVFSKTDSKHHEELTRGNKEASINNSETQHNAQSRRGVISPNLIRSPRDISTENTASSLTSSSGVSKRIGGLFRGQSN